MKKEKEGKENEETKTLNSTAASIKSAQQNTNNNKTKKLNSKLKGETK